MVCQGICVLTNQLTVHSGGVNRGRVAIKRATKSYKDFSCHSQFVKVKIWRQTMVITTNFQSQQIASTPHFT